MKTISSKIRILATVAVFGAFASIASAGPGLQYWKTLGNEPEFQKLKAGEKIVMVCNMCKTISEIPITSAKQAMELCKEGNTVTCPSCKMKSKVVIKRQRNDPPTHTEITYVNESGVECAFFAKVSEKK